MSFLAHLERVEPQVTGRLRRMVGPDAAEDLRQELLLRAWRSAPRDLSEGELRAWLHRVGSNLAIDELRRRRVRDWHELDDEHAAPASDPADALAAREALGRAPADERALLYLRFEAGLGHAEIAEVLGISPEAARKRVSRARAAFVRRFRETPPARAVPVLLLLDGNDDVEAYVAWLEAAGAEVRLVRRDDVERQLATADGLVMTGSVTDLHPALYGETSRASFGSDLRRNLEDLRTTRAALRAGTPILGVCRGHQLMNIAMGGTLWQDVNADGVTRNGHRGGTHSVSTGAATTVRRWLGSRPEVSSEHHQALRRLGRGLHVTSTSPDGVAESIELTGPSFGVGVQWHPELESSGDAGRRLAEAFVATCGEAARAA